MGLVYDQIREFKRKFKSTIAWRVKAHSKVIEKHLNPGEDVTFSFAAQGDKSSLEIFNFIKILLVI